MDQKQESPAFDGAFEQLAWRLDASKYTHLSQDLQPLAGPRFERLIERVHALGVRPLGEMLAEIAVATGRPGLIADRVEKYSRLDPDLLHALGADSFPPSVLEVVR